MIIDEIAWKGTSAGSTHEWLELANNDTAVNISGWTIKDGESQLNITLPDGATIGNGGFYVIKRTTSDITPYDFSTTFKDGLSDAGEKLILADSSGATIETLDFSGGWPDPTMTSLNSMQWDATQSLWVSATSTPGSAYVENTSSTSTDSDDSGNTDSDSSDTSDTSSASSTDTTTTDNVSSSSSSSSNTSSSSGGGSSSSSTKSAKSKIMEVLKIKTQIISKSFGFAGVPLSMQATTFNSNGAQLYSGRYFLNFGDGDSKEMKFPDTQSFTHTYFYGGDYFVSVSHYVDNYSKVPDATNQINIKIVPASIFISKVGGAADFFVELSNDTGYDADISNWVLASGERSFTFPQNTILQTKNQIRLSPKITNFSIADRDTLKLLNSEGDVVFDYAKPDVGILQGRSPTSGTGGSQTSKANRNQMFGTDIGLPQDGISTSAANLAEADSPGDVSSYPVTPILVFISALIFIVVCASLAYFVRRKKVVSGAGSDFEILDE